MFDKFEIGNSYMFINNYKINENESKTIEIHTFKCLTKAFSNNKFWGLFEHKINNVIQNKPVLKEIKTIDKEEQYITYKHNKITARNIVNDI